MADLLKFVPILNRLDLVSASVAECISSWRGSVPVQELWVAEIDPNYAGGTDFCARYGFKHTEGANCVVVEGQRGNVGTRAAVVIPVGCRTDFNSAVRKRLGARRVSLLSVEDALAETNMEYGSITPVGLPSSWKVLIDTVVSNAPRVVIGSGLKHSKLSVPGAALLDLEGAEAVEGLARAIT
jgi:prolyl-tRNA editing enzyme YbaK/EbsC (Cys-tRNA(Pro) deacylase)